MTVTAQPKIETCAQCGETVKRVGSYWIHHNTGAEACARKSATCIICGGIFGTYFAKANACPACSEYVADSSDAPMPTPVVYLYVKPLDAVFWLDPAAPEILLTAPVVDEGAEWAQCSRVDWATADRDKVELLGVILASLTVLSTTASQ